MKTRIFKTVFPVIAFIMAVTAAFAFSNVPSEDADLAPFVGHYKQNNQCASSGVMCQDDTDTGACTFGSVALYKRISGTNCGAPLWKIE